MSRTIDDLMSPAVTDLLGQDDDPPAYATAIITLVEYVGADGQPYLGVLHDPELPVWRAVGMLDRAITDARTQSTVAAIFELDDDD